MDAWASRDTTFMRKWQGIGMLAMTRQVNRQMPYEQFDCAPILNGQWDFLDTTRVRTREDK
jgi:hypothetical protein